MNPSPKRSSKSPKTTPSEKGLLSEQLVNLIKAPVQSPESAAESPTLSPPAPPAPGSPSKPTEPTDGIVALSDKLLRPRQRKTPTVQTTPKDTEADTTVSAEKIAGKEKSGDAPASVGKTALKNGVRKVSASSEQTKTAVPVDDCQTATTNETISAEATPSDELPSYLIPGALRQLPIPPASEPKQYRAVGLVRGRYASSEDQFTRGTLTASDGTAIDAVLLGRVMSLVKNHINLEEEHLWVVYPRTRQQDGNLHAQIMGIWEPQTLKKPSESPSETDDAALEENQEEDSKSEETPVSLSPAHINVENGYFSIRGEVIYQSQDEEKYIIVKIRQAPRKDGETMKFFKLKLDGELAEKAVGYFWEFDVHLQADKLSITQGKNIGPMPVKKKPFNKGGGGGGGFKGKGKFTPPKRDPNAPRPDPPNRKPAAVDDQTPPKRTEPLSKPVKKPKVTEG
jgi:hypothetical protein